MNRSVGIVACLSLGAMATLTGCMVGPNYSPPPTTMPAAYGEQGPALMGETTNTTNPADSEVRWWRRFEDPQLTSLVEKAVKANYSVAAAAARLREARAQREMVQAMLFPQVGVGASFLRYRIGQAAYPDLDLRLPGGLPVIQGNLFQVGFDATWVVDVFGGTRRGVESAKANEQAADAVRRGVVLMVAAETARAYAELRGVQRQLDVDRTTLEEQRQTLAVTEDKRKNGLASELEVVRARTEVESTASEIPPLEQAIRQYIHVLSTLLGLEPTALSSELERPVAMPRIVGQLAFGIPSDLLRRRPDIQAAERQLAAATAQVGVATANLFPKVLLGFAGGVASSDIDNLLNVHSGSNSSSYYSTGPAINWTIFDGGLRQAGVRLSKAQVDAAKASYQDTVLRAFREVESALVAVRCERARVENLTRLSASASESADIARRDYERGILDQLTVLDAQRQANRADMLLAEGQMSLAVNMVTLYKALGGGWEVAEPPPATQPAAEKIEKGHNP